MQPKGGSTMKLFESFFIFVGKAFLTATYVAAGLAVTGTLALIGFVLTR